MKKRVFSAEFKAERVLEVLRDEKELNQIASGNS
jgi:transposase-like protein